MKIESNGVAYEVEITGAGEPLLLLHGFTGDSSTWKNLSDLHENYRCIMPDLIGHGKTDHPEKAERYRIEEAANDLRTILEKLNIDQVHVVGYSMGGRLGLAFAVLHSEKVKTLTLESASPGLATEEERDSRKRQDDRLAEKIEREGIASFVEYWQDIPLFQSQNRLAPQFKRQIHKQRLANSEKGLANSLRGMGTGVQPSWWNELQSLAMPVFLITGSYDEKFCRIAKAMKECIKRCEWRTIQEAGHAIHVENPEMFGRIVSGFVEKWRG
ncbi:MAG: 2-succinyl-6-hydroxy-2,4-cyclohexadiene-1-carboxylate synthase [Bacillus sp. (in: firmicutes)]